MTDDAATRRAALAARQAALVAALVTGGDTPRGVDPHRVAAASDALLRKRTGEVARRWPALLATDGARTRFAAWARTRPPGGSLLDGWDFAEHLARHDGLDAAGAAELAAVRARWARRDDGTIRRRRLWSSPRALARRGR